MSWVMESGKTLVKKQQPLPRSIQDSPISSPIVKWPGGKSKHWNSLKPFIPKSYNTYFEPFLGSAAIFLAIRPTKAILGDLNSELINFYNILSTNYISIYNKLRELPNTKEHYYQVRQSKPKTKVQKAVRFFYLNKTCYNGLFRTNLKGEFNVPFGNNERKILGDRLNFESVSRAMRRATLLSGDFEDICKTARPHDFIFFDPPYTVAHQNNGFIKYNATLFAWKDQQRLKLLIDKLTSRGVMVLLTNADHHSIRELYCGYRVSSFNRSSTLSGAIYGRRIVSELVITNYSY